MTTPMIASQVGITDPLFDIAKQQQQQQQDTVAGESRAAAGDDRTRSDLVRRRGQGQDTVANEARRSVTKQRIFKVIVIGDTNVGKTCLTVRFCGGQFPVKTEATIGVDFREKNVDIQGDTIKLQIWDTAGQERFRRSMVPHFYRNADAVVFVYDVTKRSSFDGLASWIDECEQNVAGADVPRLLVGNKCDLRRRDAGAVVETNAAQRFADVHRMAHFETSAKDDSDSDHVEAIFLTLAYKLKGSRPWLPAATTTSKARDDGQQTAPSLTLDSYGRREQREQGFCAC